MEEIGEVLPNAEVINGLKGGAHPPFLLDAIYLSTCLLYVCYFFEIH